MKKLRELLTEQLINDQELEELGLDPLRRILPKMGRRELPVKPVDNSQWVKLTDPERLKREFTFEDRSVFREFLREVLDYEDSSGHSAVITLNDTSITVEVWTRGVDCVTEIDIDYTRELDQLAEDVIYRHYNTGESSGRYPL